MPNGKHKIVFIDFGNYAEVDEILELTEALASIPCHLQRFFMRGVKRVESDLIDNEIDRKVHTYLWSLFRFNSFEVFPIKKKSLIQLFERFKQRLNAQEVTVITKGDPELGVTVLLDGSNINTELKRERKRLILSLGNPLSSK